MENTAVSNEELNRVTGLINRALVDVGYKRVEAYANAWQGERSGVLIQRIYLNGKKASGYVSMVDGVWSMEKVNFAMLQRAIGAALSLLNSEVR